MQRRQSLTRCAAAHRHLSAVSADRAETLSQQTDAMPRFSASARAVHEIQSDSVCHRSSAPAAALADEQIAGIRRSRPTLSATASTARAPRSARIARPIAAIRRDENQRRTYLIPSAIDTADHVDRARKLAV